MREKSQEPRSRSQEEENQEPRVKSQDSGGKNQEPRVKSQDRKSQTRDRNKIVLIEDVVPLIPQKPPFVMVGKLLYSDERVTRSSFLILADNLLIKNNFFQEAGLMENIAQTAALRAGYTALQENTAIEPGYIVSIKDFEVFKLPTVNNELITEIAIENQVFNLAAFSGKVWAGDALIATAEMKVLTGSKNDEDEK